MFLTGLLTTMEEPVAYDKMSDEKLLTAVRQQGYKLKRFDMERNCAEVEGWNAQGARVELRLDPTSARVVSCKYK